LATDKQTDKQTDRQTNKQMDSFDALSRYRYRERRLNNRGKLHQRTNSYNLCTSVSENQRYIWCCTPCMSHSTVIVRVFWHQPTFQTDFHILGPEKLPRT